MIKTSHEQIRTEVKVWQEEMKATVKVSQGKMEAALNSIQSELEKTIRNQVEDVLAYVAQQTQGLREELNAKLEEIQLVLQTSLSTENRRLC